MGMRAGAGTRLPEMVQGAKLRESDCWVGVRVCGGWGGTRHGGGCVRRRGRRGRALWAAGRVRGLPAHHPRRCRAARRQAVGHRTALLHFDRAVRLRALPDAGKCVRRSQERSLSVCSCADAQKLRPPPPLLGSVRRLSLHAWRLRSQGCAPRALLVALLIAAAAKEQRLAPAFWTSASRLSAAFCRLLTHFARVERPLLTCCLSSAALCWPRTCPLGFACVVPSSPALLSLAHRAVTCFPPRAATCRHLALLVTFDARAHSSSTQ